MSRMNRVVILVGLLLMLMSSAAMAFNSVTASPAVRVGSLTGGDDFNGNFFNDSNGAWTWYGRIFRNADHVRATWGGSGLNGGANNSVGLIKSEEGWGAYMLHLENGEAGTYGEFNRITLGYGIPVAGFDLGVIYNRQGEKATMGDTDMSEVYNTFGLGGSWDMDDDTLIDGVFQMTMGGVDDGDDNTDDFEYSEMHFGARAFWQWRDDVALVPAFWFMTGTETIGSADDKYGFMGLGVACNYTINEDNDLWVGANYQQMTEEPDGGDKATDTTMPGLFAAVEHELTDMFTVRMGASKNFYTESDGADPVTETTSYPYGFTLGMGLGLGDWVIDLSLNQSWLYNFGYWVHGTPGGSPIAKIETKLWF